METKVKDSNKLGFKTYFGTSTMGLTDGFTNALMTTWFMIYLTDYAGLGALGAVIGSTILLIARIFDAVNDPLEGWIMDRAKVGSKGKYKPFIMLSILLSGVGVTGLFFTPSGNHPMFISIWVILFYLIYDIGASFYAPNLVYRTLSLDANVRGKLMIGPRLLSMIVGMATAGLIAIVNAVNGSVGDMHLSFGFTVASGVLVFSAISLFGISHVKERFHGPQNEEKSERVKITDFFLLLKENKALLIRVLDMLFSGFIWTFLFATALYYIKWGLCTDLTTGAVDTVKYGNYSMIASILMFIPMLFGTIIAAPLMKQFSNSMQMNRFLLLVQAIPCGVLFMLHVTGVLSTVPILFFACTGITATAIGCGFMPGGTLEIECMDYEIYKNGKDRSALCNACFKFLNKAQSAIANALIGFLLITIGYVVDSKTGDYAGDIAQIPSMLTGFIIIMGLIPFFFGMTAWFITSKYPITNEMRVDMKEKLRR